MGQKIEYPPILQGALADLGYGGASGWCSGLEDKCSCSGYHWFENPIRQRDVL
ncbi:hypothetical protein VCHA50P415_40344 [Vibrio chagasii]|nr:hypothetical protein VCHA50P415_40344 [Vibrio chagasii]